MENEGSTIRNVNVVEVLVSQTVRGKESFMVQMTFGFSRKFYRFEMDVCMCMGFCLAEIYVAQVFQVSILENLAGKTRCEKCERTNERPTERVCVCVFALLLFETRIFDFR